VPAASASPAPAAVSYGVSVVPSLGTASQPLTNPLGGDVPPPLVLAPQVAGQPVAAGRADAPAAAPGSPSGLLAVEPVRDVAAATLSIVRPSWTATALALVLLVSAAGYAAVLRRRGAEVPEALAVARAIRPADLPAARSVRPADLGARARSVRP
jgi:hypothetical protein